MSVNLIVAVGNYVIGKGYPIGKNGQIPWHSKSDLKWFKEKTTGYPVIMGRKTWESLPHALTDRTNIVVSSGDVDVRFEDRHIVSHFKTPIDAIKAAKKINDDIFIIGGASLYKYVLEHNLVDRIYVDFLREDVSDADTFMPEGFFEGKEWEQEGSIETIENRYAYASSFVKLRGQNNHVDEQYLKLVNEIIEHGEEKYTRAGKTHSVFSRQMRFNLKEGIPMLTTKKMFSKGVIHELLWFLKGDTNIKYLIDNNVHIWDDDAYRYYLELANKEFPNHDRAAKEDFIDYVKEIKTSPAWILKPTNYNWGDLNNVYGYQWTKWGEHNQVQEVIDKLKTNPDDRRLIISAWNVEDIPNMALPPCHFCCQFYTKKLTKEERLNLYWGGNKIVPAVFVTDEMLDEKNIPTRKLSCVWHQRSVDCGLGLGFNILSYSILTHLIAHCVNMDVDELVFDGGDVHVYDNHIESLREQINRNPHMYALPTLKLNPDITDIFDFKYEDITIENYQSYPTIKMPLSVGL